MEILDLYDDSGKRLDKTVIRGEKFDKGNIMLVISFIKNSNNEYLIQKTSKEKGSKYALTGGHVTHGEEPFLSMKRELEEELGVCVDNNKINFLALEKHLNEHALFSIYEVSLDIPVEDFKLQEEEVDSVFWMRIEEIEKLIEDNKFLESHAYLCKKYLKEF